MAVNLELLKFPKEIHFANTISAGNFAKLRLI